MKKEILLVAVLLAVILSANLILAQEAETEKISRETAASAIASAEKEIKEMENMSFSVTQVTDIMVLAKNLYDTNVKLEEKGEHVDFAEVIHKTDEIAEIKKNAFLVFDEITALRDRMDELSSDQDMSEAIAIFSQAEQEFNDGRYSQASLLVDGCYSKISELGAVTTKLKAVYEAGTKTIFGFLKRNFKVLGAILIVFISLYIAFKKRIILFLIKKKEEKLEFEKSILNDLVKKAQNEYFEKGTLSEGSYRIRIQKFGELIRDIDRKLSLLNLKEEETLRKKSKTEEHLKNKENKRGKEEKIDSKEGKSETRKKALFDFMHGLGIARTKEEKSEMEREMDKRKRNEERRIKEEGNKRRTASRRKAIFKLLHALKLVKTKEEGEEIEKRIKERNDKKEAEKKKKEEQRRREAEQKKKEERAKKEWDEKKKAEEKRIREEKRRKRAASRKKIIFKLLHALGLVKTKEEKEHIIIRKRLESTKENLEKEVKKKRKIEARKKQAEAKQLRKKNIKSFFRSMLARKRGN